MEYTTTVAEDNITSGSPVAEDSITSRSWNVSGEENTTLAAEQYGCDRFPDGSTIILAIAIGLVALITISGNALVIISFITDQKLRSFGNYFIINLALADFIIGILICIYTPYFLTGCWKLGRRGCRWFNWIDYITPLASAWNMAVISLDRYFSVARPIDYRQVNQGCLLYMCMYRQVNQGC